MLRLVSAVTVNVTFQGTRQHVQGTRRHAQGTHQHVTVAVPHHSSPAPTSPRMPGTDSLRSPVTMPSVPASAREHSSTEYLIVIGCVSLARENEAGGSWGQEVHILHVNIIGLCFDFGCNNRIAPK